MYLPAIKSQRSFKKWTEIPGCWCVCAGGEIASTFDNPGSVKLGQCKLIEEIMIGEDKLIHFSGVAMGEACTIVLRGASAMLFPFLLPLKFDALLSVMQTASIREKMWLSLPEIIDVELFVLVGRVA